jgi:hypothetical protein
MTMPPDLDFARIVLEGVLALDRPIGALMEVVGAMNEGNERSALKTCSGELLHQQFELIERITETYPELDRIVESWRPSSPEPS